MWDVAVPRVAEPADQVSRPQARALADPGRDRAGLQMAVGHIPPAPNVLDNTVPPGGRSGHVGERPDGLLVRDTVNHFDDQTSGRSKDGRVVPPPGAKGLGRSIA